MKIIINVYLNLDAVNDKLRFLGNLLSKFIVLLNIEGPREFEKRQRCGKSFFSRTFSEKIIKNWLNNCSLKTNRKKKIEGNLMETTNF